MRKSRAFGQSVEVPVPLKDLANGLAAADGQRTATGKERLGLGHRPRVTPRFSDDGRTPTTTCDELRRTWDVSSRAALKLLREELRHPWEGICGRQVVGHSSDGGYSSRSEVNNTSDFATPQPANRCATWRGLLCPGRECNDADLLFTPDGAQVVVTTYYHDLIRKPDGREQ
jgi:hypothetical protein